MERKIVSKFIETTCAFENVFENGFAECSNFHLFGSVCEFECDVGFSLIGEKDIVCMEHGIWSSNLPICEGKMFSN